MCRASLAAEPTTPLFDSRSAPAQRTQSCGTSLSIEGADARGSTAIAPARSTNTTLPRVETTCPSWGSVLACRTVTVRMLGVGFNTTFARVRITIVWHGTVRALCVRRRTEERAQHRHAERWSVGESPAAPHLWDLLESLFNAVLPTRRFRTPSRTTLSNSANDLHATASNPLTQNARALALYCTGRTALVASNKSKTLG